MKKGFTLVELLVVIAIIAILTQVVIANMNEARKKSRDAKRVSDIGQLQLALELYFDRCNAYPAALSTLESSGTCGSTSFPSFIPAVPIPPLNSPSPDCSGSTCAYIYRALNGGSGAAGTGSCVDYHLGATLELNNQAGALRDDIDVGTTGNPALGTRCAGNVSNDFSGADPVYDVKP